MTFFSTRRVAHFEIEKANAEETKTVLTVKIKLVVCGYREGATMLDFPNAKRCFLQTVRSKEPDKKKCNVTSSPSN